MTEAEEAFGGGTFIADTSVWLRVDRCPVEVQEEWAVAVQNGQILSCPIVLMELLFTAQNLEDVDDLLKGHAALRSIPVTRSICDAATQSLRDLAAISPLYHRGVKLGDTLIAACAQDASCGVLHYDRHFDRLTEVIEFESRVVVPFGSISG